MASVIVWEFQADLPGMFAPYTDTVSNHIEKQYNQHQNTPVPLGTVEPALKEYSVDFNKMVQVHSRRATQRQVRRQQYDHRTALGKGIVWEWLTDVGWIIYDVETLNAIESAFAKNEKELDLEQLPLKIPNVILIQKGYQKNKNSGFVRPIQRRSVAYLSTSPQQNTNQSNSCSSTTSSQQNINHSSRQSSTSSRQSSNSHSSPIKPPVPLSKRKIDILEYCDIIKDIAGNEDCAICLIPLKDSDDDDDDDDDDGCSKTLDEVDPIVQLKKCKHSYHKSCMEAYCKQGSQNGCIQCPICKTIHGIKKGNQPPGKMNVIIDQRSSVAGYEGNGMITITYDIHSGMQGPEHPNPSTPYTAQGFPRIAYLPANTKGRKVLKLLKIAWDRRLVFTIGTSTTTGLDNAVIWNEIHHKTSPRDRGSGHGFPDPTYLDNVIDELKQHGVVDEETS